MSTNENQKRWPMEIVKTVGSSRSTFYREWTLGCSSLLLRLLWSLQWSKDHWWEKQGALFFRIHYCSNVFSPSWLQVCLKVSFHLTSISLQICWKSLTFWGTPLYGNSLSPYLARYRHCVHPLLLQSGWLRYSVPCLGWPGSGMNLFPLTCYMR